MYEFKKEGYLKKFKYLKDVIKTVKEDFGKEIFVTEWDFYKDGIYKIDDLTIELKGNFVIIDHNGTSFYDLPKDFNLPKEIDSKFVRDKLGEYENVEVYDYDNPATLTFEEVMEINEIKGIDNYFLEMYASILKQNEISKLDDRNKAQELIKKTKKDLRYLLWDDLLECSKAKVIESIVQHEDFVLFYHEYPHEAINEYLDETDRKIKNQIYYKLIKKIESYRTEEIYIKDENFRIGFEIINEDEIKVYKYNPVKTYITSIRHKENSIEDFVKRMGLEDKHINR